MRWSGHLTKKRMLVILVIVAVIVVALGAMWPDDGDAGPGAYQTDRDTVMDQAPTEPPGPPQPPGGRTGDEP